MDSVKSPVGTSEDKEEIVVNFQTLFELVRSEKIRDELQALPSNFYEKLISYLKEQGYDRPNLSYEEMTDFENIKKLIKDLYELRENKIVNLALVKSRIEDSVVDIALMTDEEKAFFDVLVDIFRKNRRNILSNIYKFKRPSKIIIGEESIEESTSNEDYVTVRFLNSLPSFVGSDMNVYGPFKKEDIATLPREIAEVLIKKNRAEKIDL